MTVGLGIDVIDVARIRSSCERFGDRFLRRVLRESEVVYCQGLTDPAPSVAARFAAKEAVSKAFGTGIGAELGWHDIEILRLPSGQPTVRLHGLGLELLAKRGGQSVHISLTHTREYAAAVAIVER
jgi:holo-[acyl-carrier protein] synthase